MKFLIFLFLIMNTVATNAFAWNMMIKENYEPGSTVNEFKTIRLSNLLDDSDFHRFKPTNNTYCDVYRDAEVESEIKEASEILLVNCFYTDKPEKGIPLAFSWMIEDRGSMMVVDPVDRVGTLILIYK